MGPLPAPRIDAHEVGPARGPRSMAIHGYSGTPFEVSYVAQALADDGHRCALPLLPGHGATPELLNRLPWQAYVAHARAALGAARARVMVGCSMGGLVALHLAAEGRCDAVVLLAPALCFFPATERIVDVLGITGAWRLRPMIAKEAPGGDVEARDAARANPTYDVMPTGGLVQLRAFQHATRALLPHVRCPVLAIHGARDGSIDPRSSVEIVDTLGSKRKQLVTMPLSRHLVGIDVERDDVVVAMRTFLKGPLNQQG